MSIISIFNKIKEKIGEKLKGRKKKEPEKKWWTSFGKASRWLTKLALFLAPLVFLPFGTYIGLGKQVVFGGIVFLAFCFWTLGALFEGGFSFANTVVTWIVGGVLWFSGLNFVVTGADYQAFIGFSGNFLSLYNMLVLAVLFWLLIAEHYGRRPQNITEEDHRKSKRGSARFSGLKWFLAGGGLAVLFGILQLFGGYLLPFGFARQAGFNTVGSINSLAILAGFLVAVGLGVFIEQKKEKKGFYLFLMAVGIFYLLLVSFVPVWYGLLGVSFIYFSYLIVTKRKSEEEFAFSSRDFLPVFAVLVLVLVALFVTGSEGLSFSGLFNLERPTEVSLTHSASLSLARKVYKEGALETLLGSGWASYNKKWALYKRKAVNKSRFWQMSFNKGSSGFTTSLVELGVVGTVLLLGLFLSVFWRAAKKTRWVILSGVGFMLIIWFFHPFNFTLWTGVFVLAAIAAND